MRKFLPVLLLPPLIALVPILADAAENRRIVQKGRAFRPGTVTIMRGESLTFTNGDSFVHQVYVDGQFDSEEKGPGENINQTFLRSGTFQVRCHIHPTMKMTVHVK
jgi:plastocyanin